MGYIPTEKKNNVRNGGGKPTQYENIFGNKNQESDDGQAADLRNEPWIMAGSW